MDPVLTRRRGLAAPLLVNFVAKWRGPTDRLLVVRKPTASAAMLHVIANPELVGPVNHPSSQDDGNLRTRIAAKPTCAPDFEKLVQDLASCPNCRAPERSPSIAGAEPRLGIS